MSVPVLGYYLWYQLVRLRGSYNFAGKSYLIIFGVTGTEVNFVIV